MIPSFGDTGPSSRSVAQTVRYIARLPPDSPVVRQWEQDLSETMTAGCYDFPIPARRSPHSEDMAKQFRHRCFLALKSALRYSANGSPSTPFSGDQIQSLYADFGKLASGFGPDDTSFCETLAGLMNHGKWAEVIYTISAFPPLLGPIHVANRMRAVQNSVPWWTDTYGGDALKGLLETFREAEEGFHTKAYYSKTLDIIQSSGSGKSRMMAECGNLMIQISFPLRFDQEAGFPPGDPEVFTFLNGGAVDYQNTHSRAIAFLAAFVSSLQRWHRGHFNKLARPQLGDVLKKWNAEVNTPREDGLEGTSDFRTDARRRFCFGLVHDAEGHLAKILKGFSARSPSGLWNWEKDLAYERNSLFREILLEPLQRLLQELPRPNDNLLPRILLGIDEAGNLLTKLDGKSNTLRITAIRRVLRSLNAYHIWVVFLSTNGRMETFTTSQAEDPSTRVERGQLSRIAPYVSLELHVAERRRRMANKSERLKPMSQYATNEHTTGFGRPLWRLYSTKSYTELSDFVLTKLLRGGDVRYMPRNKYQAFAAVSSRVTLNPSENEESVQLAWASVHYHLGMLVAVNMQKGTLLTTTASEPVVSDAVAKLLMGVSPGPVTEINWIPTLQTLVNDLLNTGVVGRGTRGELYCQIILICARDILLSGKTNSGPRPDFHMSLPFSFQEFLDTLLGENVACNAYACRIGVPLADMPERQGPAYLIRDGHCNFSHFVFTNQDLKPETFADLLLDLLRSNAALQLSHGQANWDQLIPVYFGDPNAEMDLSKIGAMFIQAKNRIDSENMRLFAGDYAKYLPPGALVLYLQVEAGVEALKGPTTSAPMPVFTQKRSARKIRRPKEPFVLGIQLYGHHVENFPFLSKRPGLFNAIKGIVDGIKIPRQGTAGAVRERLWGHHPMGYFCAATTTTVDQDGDSGMKEPGDR